MDLLEWSGHQHERHPWERARAAFFTRIVRDAVKAPIRLLDVGSGDGWLARSLLDALPPGSEATCCDTGYSPEILAKLPSRDRVRYAASPPEERFDLVLLLDVLEHVRDDQAFATELVANRLEPGGLLLASVPAWQRLYSQHDELLGHERRYSPAACAELLRRSGLEPLASGGLFHSLLVPRALRRAAEATGLLPPPAHVGEWRAGRLVTGALLAALSVDCAASAVLSRRGLVVPGLSWWALCRKLP
ncbi:MAG TPA: class I SAM-dependent methyltransferase [Myxococcales bacterium]|nr:class I SAM-dependent methyltransferase [Myxococcales bacterium]